MLPILVLLAGCAERDPDLGIYGLNTSQVGAGSASNPVRWESAAAVVVPADRPMEAGPGGEILFGRPGLRVEIACEVLQSGIPYLSTAAEEGGWMPLATRWPDERAADEMTPREAHDCTRLARFYDFRRAGRHLAALGLAEAEGPVLTGRAEGGETLVLDLSGLLLGEMRQAIAVWRDRITREPRFWDRAQGETLVREELRDLTARYGQGLVASR